MTDRAELPESALDRARREAQEALAWLAAGLTVLIDSHNLDQLPQREIVLRFLWQGEDAIARLEAAARDEGIKEGCRDEHEDRCPCNLRLVAAARLAGRLEQAEATFKQISDLGAPMGVETNASGVDDPDGQSLGCCDSVFHHIREVLGRERDRLRRESGK